MTEQYSDLQVDSQHQYPKYYHPNPETDTTAGFSVHKYSDKIARQEQPHLEAAHPPQRQRRQICGLAVRTFWIVAGIVGIVVVAAVVGGGVGASIAGKNSKTEPTVAQTSVQAVTAESTSTATGTSSSPSTASSSNTSSTSSASGTSSTSATSSASLASSTAPSSSSPVLTTSVATAIILPPTTASSPSISTSTTIGPTETLLVDCPSSNNTLFTPPSTSQTFQKICSNSLTSIGTNLNAVELATASLDACITACAAYNVQNATEIASGGSNICNTVCWRATIQGDDYPGVCFGFTTVVTEAAGWVYSGDGRCDSGVLVGQ